MRIQTGKVIVARTLYLKPIMEPSTNNRKRLVVWGIVGLTVLVLAAGGLLLNSLLFRTDPPSRVEGGARDGDFFSRIFGGGGESEETIPTTGDPNARLPDTARLKRLTTTAVAGFGVRPGSEGGAVRYLDRESGNVYEIPVSGATTSVRISNTTIPRTQEAYFSATSSSAFARLVRDNIIETLYLPLGIAASPSLFLEPNIVAFATSPNEEKIFYLLKTQNGSLGYVANVNGSRPRQVFSSQLQQLTAHWGAPGQITITSKASQGYDGISYAVNPTTGATRKLIGALPGLLVKGSGDGTYTLYSTFADNAGQTLVRTEKTGESKLTPFVTFPEKCAWSSNSPVFYCAVPYQSDEGTYPDSWYQGVAKTADNIWAVDVENDVAVLLYDLSKRNFPPLDIDEMKITPDNQYLVFREKEGQTLWSFSIIPPQAATNN